MEISSVFGSGFEHVLTSPPSPVTTSLLPFPTASSFTARTIKKTNSQSVFAAASTTTIVLDDSRGGPTKYSSKPSKHVPVSHGQRQFAILEVQESWDLEYALARSGVILKVQDLNVVLRHFGKLNKWKELSQLFDWMEQNGKINIASYSSYIKFIGRSLDPLKALEIYNSIKEKSSRYNVSVCNSVLSCVVRNSKLGSSIKLFNQMKQNGLVPDIVTYSTLLAGCTKIEDGYSKALELVQELKSAGLCMDSVIYGTLLSVCASNNKCKEAECYFEQMKDEGHSPNVFHYSSLLNAYSTNGNYKKADQLIEQMKASGLMPNKVILTTLLKVYVRGGLFQKSRELLHELEALGYAEDEMPYCLLMDGLAKAGNIHEAKTIFKEMKNKDVKIDGYCYSIMISALCRKGLLEEARHLASDFEARYDKYDLVILNTMLCAYCRAGEMENVMKMMRKMDALEITPDWNTFHILIRYFCKERLYLLAYHTMEDMNMKGHQLEEEICSSLIYHLGKTGAYSEAFSVYNMLRYSKRSICKALHDMILRILIAGELFKDAYVVVKDNARFISGSAMKKFAFSYMRSGNINLIIDVIKAIHSSGYNIDQEIFYLATSRYIAEPEKKELLIQMLQWMPSQGYVVESSTRNLILKNSDLFGRQLIAEILSKQHIVSKAVRSRQMKGK